MKGKTITLFLLKLIIAIVGLVLTIKFANSFVSNAAMENVMDSTYFLYIVLTISIAFILSPILLNIIFRNKNEHSISIGLLKLLGGSSKEIAKDTLWMNNVPTNKKQLSKNEIVDDRVIEYFINSKSINDIKHQQTKLNYPVAVIVSDIDRSNHGGNT